MLREDTLSLTTLLDSDFAMLNEKLATLYDVPGVTGSDLQRVVLPAGSPRGGVLGMASVPTMTSNGTMP